MKHNQYKYIYINQDVHKGVVCLVNTNMPLYLVLEDISKGYTIEEILESHPTLEREALQGALEEIAHDYSQMPLSL